MKKKINILLLIFVVGLWSMLGYRSLKLYLFQPEQVMLPEAILAANEFRVLEKDTFALEPLSRDIFLGNRAPLYTLQVHTGSSKRSSRVSPMKPKPMSKPFPTIVYFGYIDKNESKKQELVLLKVDGKFVKLKVGQTHQGLIIKKIVKDYIEVGYNDSVRSIKKSRP